MNFKKFISSVSAIAIAASAFAAMAVTADAKTRSLSKEVYGSVTTGISNNNDGTYEVTSTNFCGVIADLSGLTDIDKASEVTVQFDTQMPNVKSGSKTYIAPVMFGVGDKTVRGNNAKGSDKDNYYKDGLVAYFGSENGTNWQLNATGDNWASKAGGRTIRAIVTLNRNTGAYTATLKVLGTSEPDRVVTGTTDVDNLTIIEASSRKFSGYTFTFKNIMVTYTLDDPTPVAAGEVASFDNDEGACVYSATVTNDAAYQAETVKAVATAVGGATAEDSASVSVAPGSALEIAVIVEGKTADEIESVTVSLY